jgi:type III pantothenate kinase
MILAIDCGNSRLKWGLHENGGWRRIGAVPAAELVRAQKNWAKIAATDTVVIANVAGPSVRRRLEVFFARRSLVPVWVVAKRRECGVTNGYGKPEQLGVDRWAALIGAWSILRGPCLVVTAGTATTADVLRSDGTFAGGAILPGLDLMKRSLADGTAGLPLAKGRFTNEPRNTADAIETGCLLAQAGAIERAFATMEQGAVCVIAGGAASRIAPHLGVPRRLVDNLVLEGLVRIAEEGKQSGNP